ncbi:phage major capsid protein [uncultured Pseudacidovorax sp.]|uniref:phage major capsid protein n=1 Tax=uncultured Pseudacidovorax sp. TaxID=679313 RepID=UPI0025D3784E|nr:phage major capsid protein [uncultured Pseudacidovorax sp.]
MSIQALRERLNALNKKMKNQLAEKGSATWSKEDQKIFDDDSDEAERVQSQIAAHQRLLDKEAEENFRNAPKKTDKPQDAAKEGFELFLRKSDRQMSQEEALKVHNTMSTTTGTEGGYTVQPIVASQLIDLLKAYGFMRRTSSQITTTSGADLSYPTSDGTSEIGEWVAQNTSATDLDVTFGTRALNVFKAGSKVVVVPIELLQDSQIDVVALVMGRLRDRIGRLANAGYTVGTGTGQPMGLVTAASVGKTGAAGQTTTVIYDDLVDLVDSLDAAYLDVPATTPEMPGVQPGWMFSQAVRKTLRKIKDTAGRPIWTPSYDGGIGGKARTPDELLGYPVNINNDMPAPAANAKSIAFGNLNKYLIRDAMDVTIFRFDDSAYMKKGQVGFLAWARTGGNLMDTNAVKVYQNSAT